MKCLSDALFQEKKYGSRFLEMDFYEKQNDPSGFEWIPNLSYNGYQFSKKSGPQDVYHIERIANNSRYEKFLINFLSILWTVYWIMSHSIHSKKRRISGCHRSIYGTISKIAKIQEKMWNIRSENHSQQH